MTSLAIKCRTRRAAVAPMTAILMTVLVGSLAFSVDIGYMCAVEAELQDAADAAALAGAQQMQNGFVAYYSPGQKQQHQLYLQVTTDTSNSTSPIPTAQRYASYNRAGGVFVQVPAADISFSYFDGTNAAIPASYPNYFPNTINVTTRRDNVANGPLGLFFARIFGMNSTELTATASATIYAGDISSLQVIPGVNAHILPVALDVNVWTNFAKANWPSPWLANNVTTGPNGNPQLQIYPFDTNTPGSFGLLDIGVPSNNAPAFRNWIDSGSTPNDISYLLSNNLLPVSPSAPEPWKCGPGLKSTLVSNFQSQLGVPNLIPLFQPVNPLPNYLAATGTGQNATYAIVGFVGVTITQADGSGGGMTISVQPSVIVDPTAVILNASPARASQLTVFGTSQTTFVSAKLTQ
jgi:Flp pilus assembly protein TadG